MDRSRMLKHLALAGGHVTKAGVRVRQQEERVRKLPAGSRERETSEKTLKNLLDLAGSMQKHRTLILRRTFYHWLNGTISILPAGIKYLTGPR
jgi:hypothetical protein